MKVSIENLGLTRSALVEEVHGFGGTDSLVFDVVFVELLHVSKLKGLREMGFNESALNGVLDESRNGSLNFVNGQESVAVKIGNFEVLIKLRDDIGMAEVRPVLAHHVVLVDRLLLVFHGDGGGSGDQGCSNKGSSLHF